MYTQENPHPDLEFIERRDNGVIWYRCRKCGQYQNGVKHFGWRCAHCQYEKVNK
jgi:uncharacterized OB-fold protein